MTDTIDNKLLQKFLEKDYNLSNSKIEKIELGIENHNYLIIRMNQKYVLRVYKKKKINQIQNEIKLIEYLLTNKVSTPRIFYTMKNEPISQQANHYAVLFEFVEGTHPPWARLDLGLCEDIGNKIGLMQKVLLSYNPNLFNRNLADSFNGINNFEVIEKDLLEKKDKILRELNKFDLKSLRQSVIHSDIIRENIIVDNNKLISILDFDDTHVDYFVWDVAATISHLFITKSVGIDWNGIESFLKGYLKQNNLISEEKKVLIPFLRLVNIRLALIIDWRIKNNDGDIEDLMSIKDSLLVRFNLIENNLGQITTLFNKYF